MHAALEAIRSAVVGTQFEHKVWLVGGCVRDELLGRQLADDFDLVTTEDTLKLAGLLESAGASEVVTYARFGTAMVRWHGARIELVRARRESYEPASRKPVVHPATLMDDALRRDFTVNTLLRDLSTGRIGDPLGLGLGDLEAGVLRTPRDPADTFRDDPLRMLRAVRFRHKLGFDYAEGLTDALKQEAPRLSIVSAERIRDEWLKILAHSSAPEAMQDLMDLGLLHEFAPEFRPMLGVEQGSYHHLDVWEHSLLVLKNAGSSDSTLSLAALLHDVGKPSTRFVDNAGATRFFGHEVVGADMAATLLRRLKFSEADVRAVTLLVRSHMRLGSAPQFSASAARRLIRDLGPGVPRLLALVEADADALAPTVRRLDLRPIRERIAEVERATPAEALRSPLSGQELMQITGCPAGPEIGRWKRLLQEEVIEGRLKPGDREAACRFVRKSMRG